MVHASTVAKACTGLASIGCLVAGIIILQIASEEVREKKAAEFGQAVEVWPSERFRFSHLAVSGSFWNGGFRSSSPAKLESSSFDDAAGFQDAEDLPKYEPLSYRMSSMPRDFLPIVKFQHVDWQEMGGDDNEHGGVLVRLNLTVAGNHLKTEAIPLVKAKAHRMQQGLYNQCKLRKGSFSNGKCWIYSRLSRICLQVVNDGFGWQFAYRVPNQNTSYGCEYEKGNWTATVYKEMDLVPTDPTSEASEHGINNAIVQTVMFDDLEIVVRSVHDPFLKAIEVTEGTLDFGMTAEEGCALCLHWRKQRKKRAPYRPRVVKRKPNPETVGMKYAVDDDEVYDVR